MRFRVMHQNALKLQDFTGLRHSGVDFARFSIILGSKVLFPAVASAYFLYPRSGSYAAHSFDPQGFLLHNFGHVGTTFGTLSAVL